MMDKVSALTTLSAVLVVLIGALFNAHLNRRRDNWLRKEEVKAPATAIRAELTAIRTTLERNAEVLSNSCRVCRT